MHKAPLPMRKIGLLILAITVLSPGLHFAQSPADTSRYVPKSKTAELENLIKVGYGMHLQQLSARSTIQQSTAGGPLISEIRNYFQPNFEITYSRWFHARNYIGLAFRTGRVGYEVDINNHPGWATYHPNNPDPLETFIVGAHHLYYFGSFWQYDLTPELVLAKGKKHDFLYQMAMQIEVGVNLLRETWDADETKFVDQGPGPAQPWVNFSTEYIRTSQIRYGLRWRNIMTFSNYSLIVDAGYNFGLADFHFTDIQARPGPTPNIEIRNQFNHLYVNVGLGYWF
jgi:hypothetical protein